eukprot:5774123-Alexandrium_andersonii.AAC.1
MSASLVGSEMCIRDSTLFGIVGQVPAWKHGTTFKPGDGPPGALPGPPTACLLYTSDAADDM